MSNCEFDLYLVTDRKLAEQGNLIHTVRCALDGGVRAIQLREKDLSTFALYRLAEQTQELCERYHAELYINDRIDIALAVGAAGVHLGHSSIPPTAARKLLGAARKIGVSTHSLADARSAEASGADFIAFGPVYYTPSKAPYGQPQGIEALKKILENVALPVYAIGGIKEENLKETMLTGCRGVALISAIMGAKDPKIATERLLQLLRG